MQSDSRGDTLRRITKAALGGLAGCALVLGGTQFAAGSLVGTYKFENDDLKDPEATLANDGAFDGAKARVKIVETTEPSTTFTLRVTGIDTAAEGQAFAAHLHIGPCGNTGGHYQNDPDGGITAANEVWFSVVPDTDGTALSETTAKFVPDDAKYLDPLLVPGKMSIVIHKNVAPFAKQACYPLSVPQWAD
jgi:hypothetical protein